MRCRFLVVVAAAAFALATSTASPPIARAEIGGGPGSGGSGPSDLDGDGSSVDEGDCDDLDWKVHPGAKELCNDVDDDCNGATDDIAGLAYADADKDGWGDPNVSAPSCRPGFVPNDEDCDDADANTRPDSPNQDTETDDVDCDGVIDPPDPSYDSGFGMIPNALSGLLLGGWLAVGAYRRRVKARKET
jgi:hypothetical protein